jgi:hypothetical protein
MSRSLLVVLTVALVACPEARAQQSSDGPPSLAEFGDDPSGHDPLGARERARRLRQAQQVEPREARRALRDAAQSAYAVRMWRIQGGTDTPDVVLDLLPRLLVADLALAEGRAAERLAAREGYARALREIEDLTRRRIENGIQAVTPADYWALRCERLLAELDLARELGGPGKPLPGAPNRAIGDQDPFEAKAAARDEFEATRALPRLLAEAARDAPLREYQARMPRMFGWGVSPHDLLHIALRRVAAEGTRGESTVEYLAALEGLWQVTWYIERFTQQCIESGVKLFGPADYYATHDLRLEVEVWIAAARQQPGKPLPLRGGLQDAFAMPDSPIDAKDVARAKSEAARVDVRQLLEKRREALLAEHEARLQRIRAGTDTPDLLSTASARLLTVELALAPGRAERLAARERSWARAVQTEYLALERVMAGIKQFTPADYYEARYARILAELELAKARAARE